MKIASSCKPLITLPLTPLQFTGLSGALGFLAASYCLAHGLFSDDVINLPRTLAWAVTTTLPWVCAWEGLKRVRAWSAQSPRPLLLAALILTAAFGVCAGSEYVLAAIYPIDAASFVQILYRLLPIPLGIAVAAMLLQPKDRSLPNEPPAERVLNVPTRDGVLAVCPRDVEYIKAAGNYVELTTRDRTLLMRTTLQELSEELRGLGFVRVHRSVLVNALHVQAIRRGPRGRRMITVRSGAQLPVGRQFDDDALSTLRSSQFRAVRPDGLDGGGPHR